MTDPTTLDLSTDLLLPEGGTGTGPGVVLFQEIFGVTDYIHARARDLADLGYVVLVPHFYGPLGDPVVDEGADGLPRAMQLMQDLDWPGAVEQGVRAIEVLRSHPAVTGGVGLLGFCFGGGLAFNVAAQAEDTPDALVSYYGSALPQLLALAPEVTCASLHHFGDSDSFIPLDAVRTIEAAVTSNNDDVTFEVHQGADHAFDNPTPDFHHEQASQDAWATTVAWLAQHLPTTAGSTSS